MAVDWTFLADPALHHALMLGLTVTVILTLTAGSGALLIGVVLAVIRITAPSSAKAAAAAYINVARNVPILIQLFFVYFGLTILFPASEFPILRSPYLGAVVTAVTISLSMGAFVAEVIRGGIELVSIGQLEAALGTGLRRQDAYIHVVAPQLLPVILPGLSNEMVNVLKTTTFAMTIGVTDLMWQGQRLESETFRGLETMTAVSAIYFLLSYTIIAIFWGLDGMCKVPGAKK